MASVSATTIRLRAISIVLSIVFLAALGGGSAYAAGNAESRTITVTGTGSASGAPDIAVVRLGVESRDADVKVALATAADRTKAILAAVEGQGVAAKDLATVDYNVGFVSTVEGRLSAGASSTLPEGYYRVSDVAAVTVHDLSNLGAIVDAALSAGANEVQGIDFQIADSAGLEKAARQAAFEDARTKALQLAGLAGVRLGRVMSVSVGGEGRATPVMSFRSAALAAPAVSPGTLEVSATVAVVFAILS
ncbi:MAG TPA: SIMPL domain-containing protein [Spirochaetia bacterium]|nr:SIMPL domain-containing protein [Spirochaetia bacterium]